MTDTSLTDAFRQVFGPVPYRLPRDLAADFDEDTLRRSFGGLSRGARREQRRPRVYRPAEPWRDELAATEQGGAR